MKGLREVVVLWKWSKRIGLSLLCLMALLMLGGASYQFINTKLDERKFTPTGTLVDIGGYSLHMKSMGTGGPTVVMDAGLGNIGAVWGLVQPEIAKFTRVVSYDRAGFGWSEKGPQPRTSALIVQELHTLLHTANLPPPYILVGHSFGGANVQLFAATFPDEVLGIILVDSCHEAQEKRLPANPYDTQMKLVQKPMVVRIAATLGITRLLSNMCVKRMTPPVPQSLLETHLALCLTMKHLGTMSEEASVLTLSLKQLEEADQSPFANKPCTVISAGSLPDLSAFGTDENQKKYLQEMFNVWNELQKELVSKFQNGQQIIAEKSDHIIPWNQPEIIVQAVKDLIDGNKNESFNLRG